MRNKRNIFVCLLFLLLGVHAVAMETRIIGEVLSAETAEPIANVSVYFKGTKVGTTSDKNGTFYLHVDLGGSATLVVSSIGYKTQRFTIEPGQDVGMTVVLEERHHRLSELEVLPGANPALPLMDSVRAHREKNAPREGSYQGKSEQEYFLSHITGKTLKRRLWKSLQSGMVMQEDSSYILPMPVSVLSTLSIPVPEHMDFYSPTIPFGSLSFLSPTAVSAPAYYQYFLIDSIESPKSYIVDFRPKNSFDPLFTGSLIIDSATFAIQDVKASIPKEANVNYLSSLHYNGRYNLSAAGNQLTDEHLTAVMDIAVKTDSSHIFPALVTRQHYSATTALPEEEDTLAVYQNKPLSPVLANSGLQQPDTNDLWLFRVASWLGYIVHTGYIPTGTPIDVGNIQEIIQLNRYEKLHLGLPFRTNEKLLKYASFEGYVGYGFRDRGVKYKVQAQVILPTERRHILGVYYWDHYAYSEVSAFDELMRENSWVYGNMQFMTYLLSDVFYKNSHAQTTATRKREFRVWSENDWCSSQGARPAVETRWAINIARTGVGDASDYHYYDMPSFHHSSFATTVRMGWKERTVDIYTTRKHLYSDYPTVYLGAELGSWRLEDEKHYHMYGNLNVMIRQTASLGMGGTLAYTLRAGITLGAVPYPLLNIANGNQSYTFAQERFTLMNNNQFASDKYIQLHVNWNGQGILFNRIPGVRYLRLRELAEMKVAYGGMSEENRRLNTLLGGGAVSTLHIPYVEVGVGIGNILRFGEVYSVWRLTSASDGVTPRWAVRFRFNLGM